MRAWSGSIRSGRRRLKRNWRAGAARKLTARQDAMLVRWGYPYVFDTWFFHMTLTRRLSAEEKRVFMPAAEAHLGACDRNCRAG